MKFLLKVFNVIFITFIAYILVSSSIKNIIVQTRINNFKKECTLNETLSTPNKKFYSVSRETNKSLIYDGDIVYAGQPLDIMINLSSSFAVPGFYEIFSFTIGGHAAVNSLNYADFTYDINESNCLETAYNDKYQDVFYDSRNYWEDLNYTDSYLVFRVNLTENEKRIVFNKLVSMLDDKYNLSFLFNTKESHYCSDLVYKAFKEVGVNLNFDGFVTTMFDIATSKKVNLVVYKEYDKTKDIANYYFVN